MSLQKVAFTDGFDVLRSYDKAIMDLCKIPLATDYVYAQGELENKSVEALRAISMARGAFHDTDHKGLLIKAILNTQQIPVIFASPETSWADPEYVAGIEDTSKLGASVFYPAITVHRQVLTDDPARFNAALRRKIAWSSDGNMVLQSKQPVPKMIAYQIDTFALNMKHANVMNLFFTRLFSTWELTFEVDLGPPWGKRKVQGDMNTMSDTSSLEDMEGGRAEKLLRYTYAFTVQAWIPQESWLEKTVRKTQVSLWDNTIEANKKHLETLPEVMLPDIYNEE